jgi:hypothetical protein
MIAPLRGSDIRLSRTGLDAEMMCALRPAVSSRIISWSDVLGLGNHLRAIPSLATAADCRAKQEGLTWR